MSANVGRRLVWPLLAVIALAATAAGTRLSLSEQVPSLLGVVLTVAGAAILIALPGLASLALLVRRPLSVASRFGIVLCGSGVAAFVEFWAWVASPTLGRVVAVALLVATVVVVAAVRPTVLLDDPELRTPFGLCLLVVFAYAGLAYSQGGIGGLHWASGAPVGNTTIAMSYRYWLAPDNTLPLLFAQRVAHHGALTVPLLADWHTSDRPPLQTGFTLMLYPLFGHKNFGYELLGTLLQALWVPALWILLRSRGVGAARVFVVVLVTAATGAVFVNTVYVWPKMLAAAFMLAALAVVLEADSLILVAVLAALALLSHGGIAFSLLALVLLVARLRPSAIRAGLALAAGVGIYLPWIAYQHFVDPPGNRLLKWQLAGVVAPDRNSFLHDLVHQYLQNPVHPFLLNKLTNVENLFWTHPSWTGYPTWSGFFGRARLAGISSIVLALGPLVLALLACTTVSVRRHLRPVRPLLLFVVVSLVSWVILEFGNAWAFTAIHQGSYAVLVLMVALGALTATYLPRPLAITVIAAALAWFAIEWLPGLGFRWAQPGLATSTNWTMIGLGWVSGAVAVLLLLRSTSWRVRPPVLAGTRASARPRRDTGGGAEQPREGVEVAAGEGARATSGRP